MPKEIVDKVLDQKLINIRQTTTAAGATPYSDSIKLPTQAIDGYAEGEIQDTTPKAYFNEYGTGIVGSNSPATEEALAAEGWEYNRPTKYKNADGRWKYPKKDGTYGWTYGLPALKAYQDAADDIRDNAKTIIENL